MIATEPIRQCDNAVSIHPREQTDVGAVPEARAKKVPYRFFVVADVCLVWASAGMAYLITCSPGWNNLLRTESIGTAPLDLVFLFSVFVALFSDTQGLYKFPSKASYWDDVKLQAETVVCSGIILWAGISLGGRKILAMRTLVLTLTLSWIALAAWRKAVRSQSIPGLTEKRNVLIVGFGRTAHELARQLDQNPVLGYVVKGFVSRRRTPRPTDKAGQEADPRLLGTVDEISSLTRAHFIDEILICVPSDRNLVMEITQKAQAAGVQVRVIPDLYDGLATGQPVEYVGQFPALTLCRTATPTLSLMMKRLVDIALSGFALLVLSPLLALVALIIKLDSKGPVFFRSVTAGKKGVTLVCYKFRTMIQNADALKSSLAHLNERDGIFFKIAADPRITRVGRYLRKYSIDELPQLWNVFKGEMSLVGPRPPACGEFTKYSLEHLCRLDVTPGLTGLWQVSARRDPSFQYCVDLDKEYVRNWSLGLDFKILFRTVGVVLAGTGQ
jgi:exopolysaccharide biosynthesis polyprenyl glycosylphosphotransferase